MCVIWYIITLKKKCSITFCSVFAPTNSKLHIKYNFKNYYNHCFIFQLFLANIKIRNHCNAQMVKYHTIVFIITDKCRTLMTNEFTRSIPFYRLQRPVPYVVALSFRFVFFPRQYSLPIFAVVLFRCLFVLPGCL